MEKKGQVSFEFVLISAVVISLGFGVLGPLFTLNDETVAMAILKENALKKLSGNAKFSYIDKVAAKGDYSKLEVIMSVCVEGSDTLTFADFAEAKTNIA